MSEQGTPRVLVARTMPNSRAPQLLFYRTWEIGRSHLESTKHMQSADRICSCSDDRVVMVSEREDLLEVV